MKNGAVILLGAGLVLSTLMAGCQPAAQEPIKCVCNCDGPPPEGAKVTVENSGAPAAAPAQAAQAAPPAQRPAPSRPAPSAPSPTRATGEVGMEPGTGTPAQVSDAEKEEMKKVFVGFAESAGARDIAGMKKWTTERLGTSLAGAVEKYQDRLYRRTDTFTTGAKSGVTVTEVLDSGSGNFDVQFKFGNGESARVLFFKEDGSWRLNRL